MVRPGGKVVAPTVSCFASTMDGLARGFRAGDEFEALVERDVAEGQHRNPQNRPGWFTTAYFHLPHELHAETTEADLVPKTLVAVEGPA